MTKADAPVRAGDQNGFHDDSSWQLASPADSVLRVDQPLVFRVVRDVGRDQPIVSVFRSQFDFIVVGFRRGNVLRVILCMRHGYLLSEYLYRPPIRGWRQTSRDEWHAGDSPLSGPVHRHAKHANAQDSTGTIMCKNASGKAAVAAPVFSAR
jgi:hypothetical protein